ILNAFVSQYYANATHIPKEVFVPKALPDRELIEQWLSERRGSSVSVHVPQRGKQRELLQQAAANAQETMRQLRIKLDYDAERTASLLNDLQARLALRRSRCGSSATTSRTFRGNIRWAPWWFSRMVARSRRITATFGSRPCR